MKEFIHNITNSLSTSDGGYSARKLTSLTIIICVVATHVKWIALGNFTQLEMVLTIDYAFVAGLLGMTTYQAIKKSNNENTNNSDTIK